MNILILIINIYFSIIHANEYIWPNDYNGNITATFSEPRSRRFHAGIDVRTFGEIGSNLYAIDSGYIHRIKILPNNYGKAVYLKLNDGNIVLYSHLNKFNKNIEILVKQLYQKYQSSFFDHTLDNEQSIKINKGEIIGYTGDTGSLSGPHLHFEIRNANNQPTNPLDYYKIIDSTPPLAESITLIPLNNRTWIDGIQDYKTFEIEKINSNKYVIEDTISVIGEFGIAVATHDKINNMSFKYGIYKIELLLDNILMYSIEFDSYNFSEDHLIYTAIDYALLQGGEISHRLFNQGNSKLSFIKSLNNGKIIIDNQHHNFTINISDANNNTIQIQGVLIGEINTNPEIVSGFATIDSGDANPIIRVNERIRGDNKIFLNMVSKHNNIQNYNDKFIKQSDGTFEINNYNENFDVIEYYLKNKNGVKSRKSFLSLNKQDPYKIKGQINIKHLDNGTIVEFHEEEHSGYNPKLEIISNNTSYNYSLYRKEKNILSSRIINIGNLQKISIVYDTQPKIVFDKTVTTLSSLNQDEININGYNIILEENSFYNDMLIVCYEEKKYQLNEKFTAISKPIRIEPNEIPFKKGIKLEYDIADCKNCGFYKFSYKNEKWHHMNTIKNLKKISTEVTSGGVFCILSETQNPIIDNLNPTLNSNYRKQDLKKITFNINDILSGIDPYKIKIKIDGNELFYDYIKYRNLVSSDLNYLLSEGTHTIELSVNDKVNNMTTIKGQFRIVK